MTTITERDIFERVQQVVRESLGCSNDQITLEADLIGDLGCDSISATEILFLIEEEFNIDLDKDGEVADRIKGDNPANSISVNSIVTTVAEQLSLAD